MQDSLLSHIEISISVNHVFFEKFQLIQYVIKDAESHMPSPDSSTKNSCKALLN